MKNRYQYIPSVIFGAILLLPLLAMLFLQLGQAYIKSTREERLQGEKLVKVMLPAKEVIWEEEERELWVGDRMFDVTSYTIVGGNYHLTGVYDDDETEIAGSLLHTIFSKKGTDLLHLILLLQCFSGCLVFMELVYKYQSVHKKIAFYLVLLLSPLHLVLGPPPRQ